SDGGAVARVDRLDRLADLVERRRLAQQRPFGVVELGERARAGDRLAAGLDEHIGVGDEVGGVTHAAPTSGPLSPGPLSPGPLSPGPLSPPRRSTPRPGRRISAWTVMRRPAVAARL